MEFSQNLRLAHLQLLMNTSVKYQANWTETWELSGQDFADRPTAQPTDRLIPVYPPKLRLRGYKDF